MTDEGEQFHMSLYTCQNHEKYIETKLIKELIVDRSNNLNCAMKRHHVFFDICLY